MKNFKYLFVLFIVTTLSSCGIVKQADEFRTFSRCKFKIKTVQNLKLADVNVQKIKNYNQLSLMDVSKLSRAIAGGQFPLNFTLNLEVLNPNSKTAAMNKLEWILYIDDIEMNRGEMLKRVEIPAGDSSNLALQMEIYLKKVLKGKTFKSLVNFALNLVDDTGIPSRITFKIKPYLIIAGQEFEYPEYISVSNEF